MSVSVLESTYVEPERPFSQKELEFLKNKLYRELRLSNKRASHRCNHFYLVKENGKKAKDMQESGRADIGNCSVCFKLKKTPRNLKGRAQSLVGAYSASFFDEPEILSYDLIDLEASFYTWLYMEFN